MMDDTMLPRDTDILDSAVDLRSSANDSTIPRLKGENINKFNFLRPLLLKALENYVRSFFWVLHIQDIDLLPFYHDVVRKPFSAKLAEQMLIQVISTKLFLLSHCLRFY